MTSIRRASYFPFSILFAPDAAPGLSVTGDAALDSAVMGRLNLNMEEPTAPAAAGKENKEIPKAGTETPEAKAEREAAEAATAEETRIAGLVESTGKTAEEILAEEATAAATQERADKIAALIEGGKTAEEAEAEIAAEEASAVQTPELTDEVKTWHEAQIAAKDEELTTLRTQAEEAQAKVTELEQQLQSAGTQPVAIAPIDPLFLIDDPAKLDERATELKNFEAWALQHWDGVDPVEASADGKIKAHPGYTKEQVRERYGQAKEVREAILPAAREGIKARQAHAAQARKAYPELFDAKRPEFKVAENLLKLAPGLKAVVPNIHIVIGDALRGEKIRMAEEKARASKSKAQSPQSKVAPKAIKPSAAPAAKAPNSKPQNSKGDVLDTAKFAKVMEAGATGRAALVAAMS
jgi:hypothetical protein